MQVKVSETLSDKELKDVVKGVLKYVNTNGKMRKEFGLVVNDFENFKYMPSVASYLHEKQTSRIQSLNINNTNIFQFLVILHRIWLFYRGIAYFVPFQPSLTPKTFL